MIGPVLLILLSGNEIITFDCSNFLPWDLFILLLQVKNKNKIQQLGSSFRERNKLLFCLFQTKLSSFNYPNWELCVDCNFLFFKLLCILFHINSYYGILLLLFWKKIMWNLKGRLVQFELLTWCIDVACFDAQ